MSSPRLLSNTSRSSDVVSPSKLVRLHQTQYKRPVGHYRSFPQTQQRQCSELPRSSAMRSMQKTGRRGLPLERHALHTSHIAIQAA